METKMAAQIAAQKKATLDEKARKLAAEK